MKLMKMLGVAITIAAINSVYAAPMPKTVSIPFSNEAINTADHSGLAFNYAMSTAPATEVVCKLSNSYKSWFEYANQGVASQSGTFGDFETVVFSTTDQSSKTSEDTAYYQADQTGGITVFDAADSKSSHATLSCDYAPNNYVKQ